MVLYQFLRPLNQADFQTPSSLNASEPAKSWLHVCGAWLLQRTLHCPDCRLTDVAVLTVVSRLPSFIKSKGCSLNKFVGLTVETTSQQAGS